MDEEKDINKVFTEKITKHLYKYYWEELGLKDWEGRVEDRINEVPRNERILKTLESFIGSLRDKTVLIIGSGWGGACVAAKNLGAEEVTGIDIDDKVNEIANLRMQLEGYKECCLHGAAEYIPFDDNYFDFVYCFTVLEHVKNVRKSLSEMLRVTRKGGYIFIQAPNYLRPFERHYKIPYIPLMPKRLAKIYLKLLKRPPNFIDSVNYIWPTRVKKLLSDMDNIKVNQIASEYKNRFASLSSRRNLNPLVTKSIEPQKTSIAKMLLGRFVSRLLSNFYEAWDFIFRTHEIYFLIQKCEEKENNS
ncbi:class I SAM-dependent methyltransferase [Chloroflexota bacterium]